MWAYVKTSDNPSDDASRGMSASQLTRECRWFKGPGFLWLDGLSERPEIEAENESMLLMQKEMKKATVFSTHVDEPTPYISSKQLQHYPTWIHAVRTISTCQKVKNKWMEASNIQQSMIKKGTDEPKATNVKDLNEGKKVIIKGSQLEKFPEEIEILKNLKTKGEIIGRNGTRERNQSLKRASILYKLDPFLDQENILRVGGRIKRADIPMEVKHPIIIPRKGHVTNLLIKHYHREVGHMVRTATHNEVRQRGYWIINGSNAVSQWITNCVPCKRTRGALQTQKMADLPLDRMGQELPFTYCAVDFFGPFKIKEKRSQVKRYGVLFTCMSPRAIHIEPANSLETDAFINALRRFLNVRRPIRQIRSDRGTNFVGANNEMMKGLKEVNQSKVMEFLLRQQCDWIGFKFNVPAASHMGGVWERQIRTVRSVLEQLLRETGTQLNDESFRTLLTEVQNIVNSRPLTTDNLSDHNSPEPLTPNHLLTLKSKILLTPTW
ncbi:uncharacterized protein LOC117100237 [Anneissia japonica]|uniref:uncharacterized protein LOC117100237 n=1 Tax=Anneissia japonica TaxID=1529436 RepID=UPI0014257F71|nr:uncharacterized protein LOC117100237 [Anneissia japonica]